MDIGVLNDGNSELQLGGELWGDYITKEAAGPRSSLVILMGGQAQRRSCFARRRSTTRGSDR
jgi:hypothetical protein